MNQLLLIKDKKFKPYISQIEIEAAVKKIAIQINNELINENPIFIVVLNGAFMFASDLLKEVSIPCEISFIKLKSYNGLTPSEKVSELIGISEDLKNRTIIIIEDIVDTGNTLNKLINLLFEKNVKQIKVATALFKPDAYKKKIKIDYVGIEINNNFVVGYGLDFEGQGRNLKELYELV